MKNKAMFLGLFLMLSSGPHAHAYMAAIECSVDITIPSCDMEVEPTRSTVYGESNYNGVECEQMARQYCGTHVSCPNGNSGHTTEITCGSTNWGW